MGEPLPPKYDHRNASKIYCRNIINNISHILYTIYIFLWQEIKYIFK